MSSSKSSGCFKYKNNKINPNLTIFLDFVDFKYSSFIKFFYVARLIYQWPSMILSGLIYSQLIPALLNLILN